MENTEVRISKLFKEMGITPAILGHGYLKEAITMVIADKTVLYSVTKILYPEIAKKFNTTASRVERAIRHAIEKSALNANIDLIQEIFGYTISVEKGKPANSEFIASVAEYLVLTQEG